MLFRSYSSHQNTNVFRTRTTKNDVIAETMFKREEEVAKILTSKAWHDLMADSQPRYATMQL